jgi:CRISPR-associated endonuclease Cas1 subtype II
MSWRTIVITERVKLELQLGYLVIRGDDKIKILIEEISVLMIENTGVSLTTSLLVALGKQRVKVIFCDEKRNPFSEVISYYGSHDTSLKCREQIAWEKQIKEMVWTAIIEDKIRQQEFVLRKLGKSEADLLWEYRKSIEHFDRTNREGHAAKVYFNALFGMEFTRTAKNNINAALDYGYSILLSSFNRAITTNGFLTQFGLFHDNVYNQFNLGSDLMEPFRPLVDEIVLGMEIQDFGRMEKMRLVGVLEKIVSISGKKNYVSNAIQIFTKSVFDALSENDESIIRFYNSEL